MIVRLYLKNYVIIKEAEIDFSEGLNILTGETGAGKSIIIDSLSLILGERADFSKIRSGEDKLIAEALIVVGKNMKEMRKTLSDILGEEFTDEKIIIRRELSEKGISRNFINESLVSLSDLKLLGDKIVDIHSQNEHQSLLNKDSHLKILDNYSSVEEVSAEYRSGFEEFKRMLINYESLISKKEEYANKKSFLEYELSEINNLNIVPGEDVELEEELKKLENVETIIAAASNANNLLSEDENCIASMLDSAIRELNKVNSFDKKLEKIIDELQEALIVVRESSGSINSYLNLLNFEPERIEQIRNRLSSINRLKKKLGMTTAEIAEKAEILEKELNLAENFDFEIEKIKAKMDETKEKLFESALQISGIRKRKANELSKRINEIFSEIGLENALFRIEINVQTGDDDNMYVHSGKKLGSNGFDDAEFLIRTNKGQDFSPLRKAASGGEISRVMLAIKAALAGKDGIEILVFDEIDSGISGNIARKVGRVLKKLSESHQIICITHLPQIAGLSSRHFNVSKKEDKGVTVANIKTLNEEEKINEVAGLISGDKVTENARRSAKELMGKS